MARIEKKTEVKEEITKMKGEVVKEVRRGTRKRRPKFTCSLIFLAFVAAAISWLLWIIAATGLVQIPFFSNLAYTQPEPLRVVEPGVLFEQVVEEQFQSTLAERIQVGKGSIKDQSIQVVVREDSLTATFCSALEELNLQFADSDGAQVTVHKDSGLRLFVPIKNNLQNTALQILLQAHSQDGTLSLVLDSIKLGSLEVPSVIVSSMINPLLERYVNELNQAVGSYASIESFIYEEGWLEIVGTFAVEFVEQ